MPWHVRAGGLMGVNNNNPEGAPLARANPGQSVIQRTPSRVKASEEHSDKKHCRLSYRFQA
eukprot:745775-Pyramimonas_sp.AAC.1